MNAELVFLKKYELDLNCRRLISVRYEIILLGGICNSHIEYLPSFVFILLSTSTYMV